MTVKMVAPWDEAWAPAWEAWADGGAPPPAELDLETQAGRDFAVVLLEFYINGNTASTTPVVYTWAWIDLQGWTLTVARRVFTSAHTFKAISRRARYPLAMALQSAMDWQAARR